MLAGPLAPRTISRARKRLLPEPFGDPLAPLTAFMTAADATKTLGVGSLMLDHDFRHPTVFGEERRKCMDQSALFIIGMAVIPVFLIFCGLRVVQQYERGVIFILGRLSGAKGPGLFWIPPFISRMSKVDLRIVRLAVPPQEVITRDTVTIKVTAVVYFYVVNPVIAVVEVMDFLEATTQIGQTTLRDVLGQSELDDLLAQREKMNQKLQTIIDEYTERWGVKVTAVEIKEVELPGTMQRTMAKQAEAESEKRAKILHAEGEVQASAQLAQAAQEIDSTPSTLQLRYLQTLTRIAVENNSTVIFPLPNDLKEGTVRP